MTCALGCLTETALTRSAEETIELGKRLAARLQPGAVVAFFGDLGSGKTTMIKGIAAGLGVQDVVKSPSFVVATEYPGRLTGEPITIQHVDLYRLRDATDLASVGFTDLLARDVITLIEWADRAKLDLPRDVIRVELAVTGESEREIKVTFPEEKQ